MSGRRSGGLAARELREALADCPLLPILRAADASHVVPVTHALIDAGVRVVELTATTSGACAALRTVCERRSNDDGLFVGMGSITSEALATSAQEAGADFLVTPTTSPCLARLVDVPVITGAWTPSEVLSAWAQGPALVKLFPAASGGVRHLAALRGVFPDIPFLVTGGITDEDAVDYLTAGAVGVGLGGQLTGGALTGQSSLRQLVEDSRRLVHRLKATADGVIRS